MCLEKKKEEDTSVLETALVHQYDDLRTTLKIGKKYWLDHWQIKDKQNNNKN